MLQTADDLGTSPAQAGGVSLAASRPAESQFLAPSDSLSPAAAPSTGTSDLKSAVTPQPEFLRTSAANTCSTRLDLYLFAARLPDRGNFQVP